VISQLRAITVVAAIAGSFTTMAQAHTPYLAPTSFDPLHQGWVTLDAAFTEHFFKPEVVFDDSEFAVLDTSGKWRKPQTVQLLRTRAVIEHQLTDKGTYRFSTGVRHGAVFRLYELDGERKGTRDPQEELPAGAKILDHFQSVTLAETYITRGAPTTAALRAHGEGLELVAVTHPNDLYEGEVFRAQILFAGQPLGDQEVEVFPANAGAGHDAAVLKVKSDGGGFVDLATPRAGEYLLQTRYRTDAPAGAAAPRYSYTYTLAFEVGEQ